MNCTMLGLGLDYLYVCDQTKAVIGLGGWGYMENMSLVVFNVGMTVWLGTMCSVSHGCASILGK